MCGRFVSTSTRAELEAEFAIDHIVGADLKPSWNVAPTQTVWAVAERCDRDESSRAVGDTAPDSPRADTETSSPLRSTHGTVRGLITVRWGLVPHWAKDPSIGSRMINARGETVTQKPAYRAAAARRRCLVPADGYYEWMKTGSGKTPYFLYDPEQPLLAMAGLYEAWRDPDKPEDDADAILWTCTVITRSAPDELGHIHDRSPVVVPQELRADWLSPGITDRSEVQALLAAIPPPRLHPREVGRAVGNVRNNGPELVQPAG